MAISVASDDPKEFQKQIKELLHYCPETGIFTWKVNRKGKATIGTTAGSASIKRGKLSSVVITLFNKKRTAHELAFVYMTGRFPDGYIRKIDGNPVNNSWSNLKEEEDLCEKREGPLTADWLRKVLDYNPDTGVFTWKIAKGPVKEKIGMEAGCVHETHAGKKYLRIHIDGKMYRAHRLAWLYVHNTDPGEQIDHGDGDGLNNRLSNLSPATNSSNAKNRRMRDNCKTGVVGVRRTKSRNEMYAVNISVNGKQTHLGTFSSFEEAVRVRKEAEKTHGYHENHGAKRPL